MKKNLDEGNSDPKMVLESNPLPAAIEMKFDRKVITSEDYERIGNKIKDQMKSISEISFPPELF